MPAYPNEPLLLFDIHHSGYLGWGVWVTADAPERWTAETVERVVRYPGYKMGINLGAQTYEQNPRFARRIRKWLRMFPGRVFITGGDYAQVTGCVRTGESNVRQLVLGWDTIRRTLGVRVDTWTMSEPGNFAQLPQLLAGLGYENVLLRIHGPGQRGSKTTALDAACVWWEGPDGTRILAIPEYQDDRRDARSSVTESMWMMTRYRIATAERGNYTLDDLWHWKERMEAKGISPVVMSKDDDHNDQPAINNLCMRAGHLLAADTENDPRFRWVNPDDLFGELPEPQEVYRPGPDLFETRVTSFCDYGHSGNKDWVVDLQTEAKLKTADLIAVLAAKLVRDQKVEGTLAEAWKNHLAAQNHDLSLARTRDLMYHLQFEAQRLADEAQDPAASAILRKLDTGDGLGAVVAFNPLGWARTEYATVTLPAEVVERGVLYGEDAVVPWEVVERNAELVTMGFVAEVPSLGYRAYTIRPSGLDGVCPKAEVDGLTVRTGDYAVTFGRNGGIESLVPTGESRSVVQAGSVGIVGDIGGKPVRSVGNLSIESEGLASVVAREKGRLGEFHEYEIAYRIVPGIPYIMLDVQVVPSFHQNTPNAPGTAGDPERKLEFTARLAKHLQPTTCVRKQPMIVWPYDAAMSPVFAALMWVDYEGKDAGLALLNRGSIGQRWLRDEGEVNVILFTGRISGYRAELAVLPHTGDWLEGRVHEHGLGFGTPLTCLHETAHAGSLPRTYSFAAVHPGNITVSSIFREKGNTYLRLWEHAGRPGTLALVRDGKQVNVERVSLRLRKTRGGGELSPRQIATFRVG